MQTLISSLIASLSVGIAPADIARWRTHELAPSSRARVCYGRAMHNRTDVYDLVKDKVRLDKQNYSLLYWTPAGIVASDLLSCNECDVFEVGENTIARAKTFPGSRAASRIHMAVAAAQGEESCMIFYGESNGEFFSIRRSSGGFDGFVFHKQLADAIYMDERVFEKAETIRLTLDRIDAASRLAHLRRCALRAVGGASFIYSCERSHCAYFPSTTRSVALRSLAEIASRARSFPQWWTTTAGGDRSTNEELWTSLVIAVSEGTRVAGFLQSALVLLGEGDKQCR